LICYAGLNILARAGARPVKLEEQIMSWKTPKVVEVSLALEINSYASAEIG
jgi:coenzyme PQQ precursor peptide PqqA